ncbi:hypothetical protein [uncultured Pontibacter sp.]|uniref:hypothetical protein n=1 Tax=uncultured Pontibacter sp. TaxID=453356 RepID=UPI002604BC68|nr:hypothetical protein [uncultured Pontibacter sp.]
MKPFKNLVLLLLVAILLFPFASSAHTADGEVVNKYNSAAATSKAGVFTFLKKSSKDDYYKVVEKKRRLAKSHRRALLRKAKKSKYN